MTDEILLAWTDSETTGLSARNDRLLEVASIITTVTLDVPTGFGITPEEGYPTFERVIGYGDVVVDAMREDSSPYVQDMHDRNGLWQAARESTHLVGSVDMQLAQWLATMMRATGARELRIAGNSVHFDLDFLRMHMPHAAALFSHRIVDITSNQFFVEKVSGVAVPDIGKPEADAAPHRAMADALWSLEQAQNLQAVLRGER